MTTHNWHTSSRTSKLTYLDWGLTCSETSATPYTAGSIAVTLKRTGQPTIEGTILRMSAKSKEELALEWAAQLGEIPTKGRQWEAYEYAEGASKHDWTIPLGGGGRLDLSYSPDYTLVSLYINFRCVTITCRDLPLADAKEYAKDFARKNLETQCLELRRYADACEQAMNSLV